jgi:hypothetical protein
MTADTPVAHGYTLRDLEQLTRTVLRMDRWYVAGDLDERYNAVWCGIVERLLTAEEPPTRRELLNAGTRANDARVLDEMRTHGRSTHVVGQPMPRFHAYWCPANPPSPETGVVERLATQQIWPRLTPRQQQALTALAALEDYQAAADHLGVTPGTYNVLGSTARRRFLAWWHEGEAPSRVWGRDGRVGRRTAATAPARKRRPATRAVVRRTGRPKRELVHGRASTYTNHGCRCGPCTQAATDDARERSHAGGTTPRRRITVSQLAAIRTRKENGETLTSIAADLGFTDSYISRLLSGKRRPAPDPI